MCSPRLSYSPIKELKSKLFLNITKTEINKRYLILIICMDDYKIIFSGTGNGRVVLSTQLRSTAGIILKLNDEILYLDPGPGALAKLPKFKIGAEKISALLVSHAHQDQAGDINNLIDAMTVGGINKKGLLLTSKSVIEGLDGDCPTISNFHKACLNESRILNPGDKHKLKDIEVTATKTKHGDPTCIGFKIKAGKTVVSYTADTQYFRNIEEQYKDSDILILCNQRPYNAPLKGTLHCNDSVKIINKVKPKLAVISQFGMKMLQANPLYEARRMQKETGVNVMAAGDDLILNALTYSKSLRQKTLF